MHSHPVHQIEARPELPDGSGGWIFKINTNGAGFDVIHVFNNTPADYADPQANLIQGSDGALYGTTTGAVNANGTLFRINTNGTGYTVLHQFGRITVGGGIFDGDGGGPNTGLLEGSDGALYGTTAGMAFGEGGFGTVFRINKDGSNYRILHTFSSSDGIGPDSNLITGSDGALYGTAQGGGAFAFGTVFRLVVAPTLNVFSTSGIPTIKLTGLAGQNCQIQISTDLTSWGTFTNLVLNTNGLAQFTASSAGLDPVRFYRASTQ